MELKGYSGCSLKIIDSNGVKRVKKTASNTSYNARLCEQKKKQEKVILGNLHNCRTYEDGYQNGLYFFVMEYINGNTFAEHIESIRLSDLEYAVNKLTSHFVEFERKDCEANRCFLEKIREIKSTIFNNNLVEKNSYEINESIKILEEYKWDWIVHSPCHGDMTLENILVCMDGLYLIDFLDSFYDTWMIDAAKLLQDCECFWSYRKNELNSNMRVRLLVFRDLCVERITKMKHGKELMDTVYHILLLNFLRILPYTKNKDDYIFIKSSIASLNKKLRGYGL